MPVWAWIAILAAGLAAIGAVFNSMMRGAQAAASGRGCYVILMVVALAVFLGLMLVFTGGLATVMALME